MERFFKITNWCWQTVDGLFSATVTRVERWERMVHSCLENWPVGLEFWRLRFVGCGQQLGEETTPRSCWVEGQMSVVTCRHIDWHPWHGVHTFVWDSPLFRADGASSLGFQSIYLLWCFPLQFANSECHTQDSIEAANVTMQVFQFCNNTLISQCFFSHLTLSICFSTVWHAVSALLNLIVGWL